MGGIGVADARPQRVIVRILHRALTVCANKGVEEGKPDTL
jgi:hypothetical protein